MSDIMQQLGFKNGPQLATAPLEPDNANLKDAREEVPTYSRDVIIDTIMQYDDFQSIVPQELADEIIKALADKHLHIFKSKGGEQ